MDFGKGFLEEDFRKKILIEKNYYKKNIFS
jgi:hypothetical protein